MVGFDEEADLYDDGDGDGHGDDHGDDGGHEKVMVVGACF